MKTFVMMFVVALMLAGCGLNVDPGDGSKIGQIVKVKQEGIICKTWEAQLIRGGMTGGSGAFGVRPFDFTIRDPRLAATLIRHMNRQTEVIIEYRTQGVYAVCSSGSYGEFLKSIRAAKGGR